MVKRNLKMFLDNSGFEEGVVFHKLVIKEVSSEVQPRLTPRAVKFPPPVDEN